ncbi:MAG TPA: PVC-type heme-binding CxxCH protein [Pedobacter sp.]|uniref:PVC-type heme-binding CxxCH protein n=1 Tax=Pedobacter sp. TaxID=1411316 RepID=UPI002BCE1D94|nr:PVC-type heme-binding CxxCH protein [Pedobacter sp.]HMI04512.1 PVC-type heme-binding CxxCH protein [Pedobacter sp.]
MMNLYRLMITLLIAVVLTPKSYASGEITKHKLRDTVKYDRQYTLETTMLGYIGSDGKRNPTLKASKGELVRIKIVNAELMTHDIALEKKAIKSKVLVEKGDTSSIVFRATANDIYYCSIPGHRAAGMVGKIEVVQGPIKKAATIAGILPKKAGKVLNLSFENGTLKDWKATGDAFASPLVGADASSIYENDQRPGLTGKYFISSGGTKNYKKTGTLISVPFTVTHPFASFKVSGGALQDTRVEIVRADNNKVIFQITGSGRSNLQPVVVDLKGQLNKQIFIRIIDKETGISQIPYIGDDKFSHINFDDFEFYAKRPNFPNELKPSDIIILPPLDPVINAGLSGEKAAVAMTPKKGFTVKLAAAEPDIVRPISFTIDARGRLWVVEAHTYPVRAPEGQGKDRVLIMEDTDGDGKLDKRTVFAENLNLVSAIEVGMGGVWLGAAPNLLFIPIDPKTDKPAGPPQIVLDGWGYQDTHEMLNNLRWGPDGWLYGTHGVFTQSNVGAPGATDAQRVKLNGGVWRYHPTKKKFELFAEGTSNPWGIDFNDYGQAFVTVCVIPHMFHVIQGARYLRQAGNHFNPYTYDDIKQIGDHVHWIGDRGPHAGNFRSNSKGGGHAHAGAMIYLGSENWPAEYRNNIFMNNIHGSRVNMDILKRSGSGFVASHGQDFLLTNDSWSQWLNLKYDQNGSVFAIDWYDKNQCHSPNPDVHQKTMGRIFKISHETDKWVKVDLYKATDQELVNYQLNKNEWYVRQARQILQERGPNEKVHKALKEILINNPDPTRKLRALWTLHVTRGLEEKDLLDLLGNENEYVRGWAIQILAEDENPSDAALQRFAELAVSDKSQLVRLYLTSALERTDPAKRWKVIEGLVQHTEDKDDHNLPLMYWYALEPMVKTDMNKALEIAMKAKTPKILQYTTQRIAAINTPESKKTLQELNQKLDKMGDHHQYHDIHQVIEKALMKNSK